MKKLFAVILVLIVALTIFVACNPDEPVDDGKLSYTMVAPDGAPALAISKLMAENYQFNQKFTYKVVPADQIKNSFVGNGVHADFGLLPVNLASLLLGQGDEYKMVGVVTHGNLYFLSKNDTQITLENAKTQLQGKSIAVVNLSAVPGLTTKALLKKIGLTYTEDASKTADYDVFLKGVTSTPAAELNAKENPVDYVVAPEPAVSTITGNTATGIKKVGALHDVYGRYPQAVLVVKSQILQTNAQLVKSVFAAMQDATDYVKANTQKAVDAVQRHLPEGTSSSFKAQNTTSAVIDGCSIQIKALDETLLQQVKDYIADIIAVAPNSAKTFAETFFVNIYKAK